MVWILISACGRVDFAPLSDASGDASPDSGAAADLLLHYEFETADPRTDSAPVAYPGACTPCPTAAAGRVGVGAALFDKTQCLEIPGSRALQPSTFTFAAWARIRAPHHGTVFGRSRDGAITQTNTFEIWFEVDPTWNIAAHQQRAIDVASAAAWSHYAGTNDGNVFVAYVNGVVVDTKLAPPRAYTPDDVAIGCDLNLGALTQHYDGTLDDVRLYSRALTPAEVAALAAM